MTRNICFTPTTPMVQFQSIHVGGDYGFIREYIDAVGFKPYNVVNLTAETFVDCAKSAYEARK